MGKWPLTFRQMCQRRSAPDTPVTLLSDRARALIRGYAQGDADGTSQYGGMERLEELLKQVEVEIEREYQVALERNVRLREVV